MLATTINLFIEPKTGTVVDQDALTTIIVDMGVQKVAVQIADVKWTDETIAEMVDLAKSSKTKLLWFETITSWLLVGIGVVLIVVGAAVVVRKGSAMSD